MKALNLFIQRTKRSIFKYNKLYLFIIFIDIKLDTKKQDIDWLTIDLNY